MAEKTHTRIVPVDKVREWLSYDPDTGVFRWRVRRGCRAAGQVAGVSKHPGYITIRVDGVIYYAHRLAWAIMTGESPPLDREIDHIDGERANNRWSNLRLATSRQNKANTGLAVTNTSGARGVTYRKGRQKWQAQISVDNRCVYLGNFDSLEEAIVARREGERKYFGEFASQDRTAP